MIQAGPLCAPAACLRLLLGFFALLSLCGCGAAVLEDLKVEAASVESFQSFRQNLARRYSADQLAPFDTAVQELKLEAMNSGVAGAKTREEKVLQNIHQKRVREVTILGWQARHSRLTAELTDMRSRFERDSKLQEKAQTEDSRKFFSNLLQNERDLIAQLERDLRATEERLREWGAAPRLK
jgi:hypothetical protein